MGTNMQSQLRQHVPAKWAQAWASNQGYTMGADELAADTLNAMRNPVTGALLFDPSITASGWKEYRCALRIVAFVRPAKQPEPEPEAYDTTDDGLADMPPELFDASALAQLLADVNSIADSVTNINRRLDQIAADGPALHGQSKPSPRKQQWTDVDPSQRHPSLSPSRREHGNG